MQAGEMHERGRPGRKHAPTEENKCNERTELWKHEYRNRTPHEAFPEYTYCYSKAWKSSLMHEVTQVESTPLQWRVKRGKRH
jgi:hypothetical protein